MRLNLLPDPRPERRTSALVFSGVSAALAVVCVYQLVVTVQIRRMSALLPSQIASQSQSIASLENQINAKQAMAKEINLVTQLQTVQQSSGSLAVGVAALVNALGTSGQLTALAYGNNELTGVFQTSSLAVAAKLTHAIEMSPAYSQVQFTNISNVSGSGLLQLSFNLTLSSSAGGTVAAG